MHLNGLSFFNHFKSFVQTHKKMFCSADESKGVSLNQVPQELCKQYLKINTASLRANARNKHAIDIK